MRNGEIKVERMMARGSTISSDRANRAHKASEDWKVSRGKTMDEVTRNAARQVVDRYRDALKRLEDH
jgi:hypothetical protein